MPKCLSKISPKIPKIFPSLYRAFRIFGSFLGQYPLDDISFINFPTRLVTSKLISWSLFNGHPGNLMFAIWGNHLEYIGSKSMVFRSFYHFV